MATVTAPYTLTVGEEYDPVLINAIFSALTVGAIIGADIATATILGTNIATNTITGSNIAALTITGSNIAADAIGASHIASNTISADDIQSDAITATKILAGAITSDKIYAGAVTADKMNVSTLSSICANLGEVTAGTLTAPLIRTSANPDLSRVVMDSGGITGYSATLGQTFKLPTDGTAPTFASGIIESCTIIDSTILSNDFKTSSVYPWVEMTASGVGYRESGTGGLYGTAKYSNTPPDLYGAGVTGYYGNSSKPLLSVEKERGYADIRLYNRTTFPSGAVQVGDLCAVSGHLYICTAAGTGVAAVWHAACDSGSRSIYIKAGDKLIFDAGN